MDFRAYIKNVREYFIYDTGGEAPTKKDFPFTESLLNFAYLSAAAYEGLFMAADTALCRLSETREDKYAAEFDATLNRLAETHIYFELLRLNWQGRVDIAQVSAIRDELMRIALSISRLQDQIKTLLDMVLNADLRERPIQERMAAYVRYFQQPGVAVRDMFRFQLQPIAFELVDEQTFTYVLHPQTIEDLLGFFLAQAVDREQPFRVCKSCGKYFALTGYRNTEYCDRVYDESDRTCKQIGAISRWQKEKRDDPIFVVYSREYKKRFARTRNGKMSKEAFTAWSEQARKLRESCIAKEITLNEFKELLGK